MVKSVCVAVCTVNIAGDRFIAILLIGLTCNFDMAVDIMGHVSIYVCEI